MTREDSGGHPTIALLTLMVLLGAFAARDSHAEPAIVRGAAALSLEDALGIALASNAELEAAAARVRVAEARAREARASRLPGIDLEGNVQRSDNPTLVFSNKLGQERFTAEDFGLESLNRPDPLTNFRTRLRVEQPLWTFGRLGAAADAAELGAEAAAAGAEAGRHAVVAAVVDAWSEAVLTRHQAAVARTALETAGAHVDVTRDLFEAGLVVESDVLRTEVREREVRELLARAEAMIFAADAGLAAVLGRRPVRDVPERLPPPPKAPDDPSDLVDAALEGRPDLTAASLGADVGERQLALALAERWPTLGLQGVVETNDPDFFGSDGSNWTVGVGLRWNLFDGGARRARIDRAEAELDEARARRRGLAARVDVEVHRAWAELVAAHARVEEAGASIDLAERSLWIVEDRYKEGLTTLPELLDAETTLTRARLRRASAHRDGWVAAAELDRAFGERRLLPEPVRPAVTDTDSPAPSEEASR